MHRTILYMIALGILGAIVGAGGMVVIASDPRSAEPAVGGLLGGALGTLLGGMLALAYAVEELTETVRANLPALTRADSRVKLKELPLAGAEFTSDGDSIG